ncbi:GfV-C16-ORF2 [Ichnoviriform fumiferanae]|uniref:GfV-C16-ORF2 n=1 Tax=Ichnoviriform fumiferanae TaxID=419435 RepID=A2PZY3_9VIRU|nr:GfV-C16-ORF2 [Ichnoviriform fumiferanae]BAF45555.1 GfV-C16-ORF2 [Ichnoviriform fumiferanae]
MRLMPFLETHVECTKGSGATNSGIAMYDNWSHAWRCEEMSERFHIYLQEERDKIVNLQGYAMLRPIEIMKEADTAWSPRCRCIFNEQKKFYMSSIVAYSRCTQFIFAIHLKTHTHRPIRIKFIVFILKKIRQHNYYFAFILPDHIVKIGDVLS